MLPNWKRVGKFLRLGTKSLDNYLMFHSNCLEGDYAGDNGDLSFILLNFKIQNWNLNPNNHVGTPCALP